MCMCIYANVYVYVNVYSVYVFFHVFSSPPGGGFYLHTPSVSAEKTWSEGSKTMNVLEAPTWIILDTSGPKGSPKSDRKLDDSIHTLW